MSDYRVYSGFDMLGMDVEEVYSVARYEWRQIALRMIFPRGMRWPRNFTKRSRYQPGPFTKVATTSYA